MNLLPSGFSTLFRKGFTSVVDQGIFSGISFIVSLLLGRWLSASDYGVYAIAMTVFLFAAGLFSSFLLEPMSVFGPVRYKSDASAYNGSLLALFSLIVLVLFFLILASAWIWFPESIEVFLALAISTPFILFFWLARWNNYVRTLPGKALRSSIVYMTAVGAGLAISKFTNILSGITIFFILGFSGIIGANFFLRNNRFSFFYRSIFQDIKSHFGYGLWIAVASILSWLSIQVYLIFVGAYLTVEEAAAFRAIQNFAQPIEQISAALGLLLVPWISRKNSEGIFEMKRLNLLSVLLVLVDLAYVAVFLLFRDGLIHLVYAGRYDGYSWLLIFFLIVPVLFSLSRGAQIGSRVVKKPQILLIGYGFASVVTLALGPALIGAYGISGAVFGRILSAAIFSLAVNILFIRTNKSNKFPGERLLDEYHS